MAQPKDAANGSGGPASATLAELTADPITLVVAGETLELRRFTGRKIMKFLSLAESAVGGIIGQLQESGGTEIQPHEIIALLIEKEDVIYGLLSVLVDRDPDWCADNMPPDAILAAATHVIETELNPDFFNSWRRFRAAIHRAKETGFGMGPEAAATPTVGSGPS